MDVHGEGIHMSCREAEWESEDGDGLTVKNLEDSHERPLREGRNPI
jgi:hypothetical protein